MIEVIAALKLPVDEKLEIKKNRHQPHKLSGDEKRICIVTGIHGDELEGQYICYEINRRINENKEKLNGIVDVYPAVNPLGLDSVQRGVPTFDLDMNRIFPGSSEGAMPEYIASKIIDDIRGADFCVDIHSSNIFIQELLQVRMSQTWQNGLIDAAKLMNVDFIWRHESPTVLEATLANSLNKQKVPTLVMEMGVGMRIHNEFCDRGVDGIFNLMYHMGIWDEKPSSVSTPVISENDRVAYVNGNNSGIFLPKINIGDIVEKGAVLGIIVNTLTGETKAEIIAPCRGMVFTLRKYPVVYQGSLIARIMEDMA